MAIEVETGRAEEKGWVKGAIVGAGASGTVSLAMRNSNGHLFAIKSSEDFDALDNEYHIMRSLDSPYIVRCLGRAFSFENGAGMHNLFLEYMPGGSLVDLLSKFGGNLNESGIRAYTHGILCGIHYLHRHGIVHCDIKGKNVLVGTNGVKLADFGSAMKVGVEEEKGQDALQLRGTPQWMPPEVVNQVEQGPASDIWSLACTVLEMLTGRPPWSQVSNPLAAMYKIGCTEELPEFPASISGQIRDFLEKCFRRDPMKRSTSVELLNHPFVKEVMETDEVVTEPESPTSNLDFGNQAWDSYFSQLTHILSHRIPSRTRESITEMNTSNEQCPMPAPRDRVTALATGSDRPNCSGSSHGQWIDVRSSISESPTADKALLKPANRSGSSIQELPFTEEKCRANLEALNSEELQARGELDQCSEVAISPTQPQHESSSSTSAKTLH